MTLPPPILAKAGDRFLQWTDLLRAYGLWKGTRIFWRLHGLAGREKITLPAGWVSDGPIELRKRNSDPEVFEQVFIDQQYRDVWREAEAPDWILDIGANVGLSALYFHERFPEARILALEPSKSNFEQLYRNTQDIPAITPLEAALWSSIEPVAISNPASDGWAFQVERASGESSAVPGYTIAHLMATYRIDRIDLLKIDIEGAERFVFEADTSWLAKVRVLAIELHDEVAAGCSAALFRALQPHTYQVHTTGENLVIRFSYHEAARRHTESTLVA